MAFLNTQNSFFFFFFFLTPLICSSLSDPYLLLQNIKPSLQANTQNLILNTWNLSIPICQWKGLQWTLDTQHPLPCKTLSSPHFSNLSLFRNPNLKTISIQLPSANLTGTIPRELADLSSLKSLYLPVNSLTGPIPLELGYSSSLDDLDLGQNQLTGPIPPSIWNLCTNLVSIRLEDNSLSDEIPGPALLNFTCLNLRYLRFGRNMFTGEFPEFVTRFGGLQELDLGGNMLTGSIPTSLIGLSLEKLNLSYNNFSGTLPNFPVSKYDMSVFVGNSPSLCGPPLGSCNSHSGLSSSLIAGIVITMMTCSVVLASLLIGYTQGKRKRSAGEYRDCIQEGSDGNDAEGKLIMFEGGEGLTLEEVLNASGQVMEKTSYGTVYKAKLADGGTIALRLLREGSCKDGRLCFPVMKQLGKARHENLVPLRAFYAGNRGEKLLIYDYLPIRTLHELLHEAKSGNAVLNWFRRHKIALGIARGLAHLHSGLEMPVVHANVRSSNVLVDEFFVARITEFGLDKLMVASAADEVVALARYDGYKAPELQKMKRCSSRTDIYAFGILLLEILMGKRPGRVGKSGVFVDLPSMVKVAVLEESTMDVFDPEILRGIKNPMEDGLVQALKLAMGCCAPVASVRPSMAEVVNQLEENRPRNRSALYSPTETRSEIGTPF